ncbi:MAG: BatA domain-containing protein, partial [Planctomycetota bacterium]
MNFIFGSLLWLLPLAAVPIIIHLLQRQRYVQVKFAATDFLRKAIQRVRRRVLLQDLLLLLLRTLAVILVILALARPSAHSQLLDAARAPQLEVVILDTSMSMQQFVGDSNAFSAAQDIAKNIFSNLDGSRDRAALIMAARHAQILSQGTSHQALLAITANGLGCGDADANWLDAVQIAKEVIGELALENSEVRLTIISDFQDNEWFDGGEAATAMQLFSDSNVVIDYQTVGAGQTSNVAVHHSTVAPQVVVKGGEVVFSCEVRNYTSRPQQRLLQLFIDGKVIAEKDLEIKARG